MPPVVKVLPLPTVTAPALAKFVELGLVKFRPFVIVKLPEPVLLLKFDRASSPTLSTKLEFGPFR